MTFHPRRDIYFACAEPIRLYHLDRHITEKEMVRHMLRRVGIPEDQWHKYPHEISGGQAQRIAIARALSLNPKLLICDEPTSMLDVSVQAQILRLLLRANEKYHVAMLFISHDLDVIRAVCRRVAVLHQGRSLRWERWRKFLEIPVMIIQKNCFRPICRYKENLYIF